MFENCFWAVMRHWLFLILSVFRLWQRNGRGRFSAPAPTTSLCRERSARSGIWICCINDGIARKARRQRRNESPMRGMPPLVKATRRIRIRKFRELVSRSRRWRIMWSGRNRSFRLTRSRRVADAYVSTLFCMNLILVLDTYHAFERLIDWLASVVLIRLMVRLIDWLIGVNYIGLSIDWLIDWSIGVHYIGFSMDSFSVEFECQK